MLIKKRLIFLIGLYFLTMMVFVVYYTFHFIEYAAIVSFKKLYSAYSSALISTVEEMDGDTKCYLSTSKRFPSDISGCERFYKVFATNLMVTKYCKDNSLKDGCLPMYKSYTTLPVCAGFSENMINRYDQTFVMNDKTSLTVFNKPSNIQNPIFAVDTNGILYPNKSGYDQFSFVIIRNDKNHYYFHPNITYCLPVDENGMKSLQDVFQ